MDRSLRIRMLFDAMDKVTGPLKAMAGGSSIATKGLKAAREELGRLKRAQADVSEFRQLKRSVLESGQAMETAQLRVAALAREMQQADSPSRKLATAFARAQREAKGLKGDFQTQSERLQQLRGRMNEAGVSTGNLAEHERRLRVDTARANAELDEQKQRLAAISARQQRMAAGREAFGRVQGASTSLAVGGAAAIGTGVAIGAPLLGAVGEARQFESVMTDIAQKANMSRAASRQMGVGLIRAAQQANQLPEALQQGVDVLAGFGLDPRQATKMMAPIGRAATAYKAEIADLSAATFAGVDNLKVPIGQTARMLDIMAAAGKSGAFEIKDMAQYFPALTAASQGLGQKGTPAVADLAAALQITRKGAGDSATAANNLQNLLNKINTKDTIKNFKEFGVDLPKALAKAAKDGKTPIEAITELTNSALKGDLSKLSFLFGDAQVQGALRPLIQNIAEYRKIRADALNAGGTVDADFAERLKDGAEQARAAEIGAKTLGLTLGAILLPTVNAVIGKATALANRFGQLAQRHPVVAKGIALIAAGLAVALVVFGGLAIAVAGVLAPFAALTAVATMLGIGMLPLIGTIAAVVAAIALIGGAVYLIYNNWGSIVSFFSGLWATIKNLFWQGIAALVDAFLRFTPLGLFISIMMPAIAWLRGLDFATIGRNLIQGLITGITGMLGALKSTIVNAASSAANWFKQKLGIHSPSRVFAGLGDFVMQGLNNGIARGEAEPVQRIKLLAGRMAAAMALPPVAPALAAREPEPARRAREQAARMPAAMVMGPVTTTRSNGEPEPVQHIMALAGRMAAAMAMGAATPALAAGGVSGAAPPGTKAGPTMEASRVYNVTINAAPGMDAQALARAVAAELDRRDRDADARRRSAYSDD